MSKWPDHQPDCRNTQHSSDGPSGSRAGVNPGSSVPSGPSETAGPSGLFVLQSAPPGSPVSDTRTSRDHRQISESETEVLPEGKYRTDQNVY